MAEPSAIIEATDFGLQHAGTGRWLIEGINLSVRPARILAIIGPAGSGKSTFLKCINRLCEMEMPIQTFGSLKVHGQDIYDPKTDVLALRRKVGMIFSRPSLPVPGIFDNVAMAPRLMGTHDRAVLARIVETALRQVGLWDTVSGHLNDPASQLPAEAQQRLCIARTLAADPLVLLFDEPTAHLDYPSAGRIEDLICQLAKKYPVLVAAQTPQQASHVADDTAFFWEGRLIESGPTVDVLTNPRDPRTESYITGRFGEQH
jgi:phosphate transport system ATP-binding protein